MPLASLLYINTAASSMLELLAVPHSLRSSYMIFTKISNDQIKKQETD